jgi:hypothetical protein
VSARLLDVTPEEYHRIDAFSSSIAKIVIDQSPAHARHAQLAGDRKATKAMDRGSVMHHLVLGKGKDFEILDYEDWRTKNAQRDRDAARAAGKTPILKDAFEAASFGAIAIMKELARRGIRLDGASEQAMTWEEESSSGIVVCKGMMDHVTADFGIIYDLKIIEDASPTSIERSAENFGHGIQRAAYTSGAAKVRPDMAGRTRMRFIFAEPEPPHAVNIVELDGMFRELGSRRWRRAIETWGGCVKAKEWPAYGQDINSITAPSWALAREGYSL